MALRDFFSKWTGSVEKENDGNGADVSTAPKAVGGRLHLSESLTKRTVEFAMLPEQYETEEIVKTFLEECGVDSSDKVIVPLLQARLLLAMVLAHRICVKLRRWDRKCEIDLQDLSKVILDQLPSLVGAQKQDEIEMALKNLESAIWRSLVETKTWHSQASLSTQDVKLLAA